MTAPAAAPPQESVVISQFLGLTNTVAQERMVPGELETATNVDLDDRGHARRRRGYTQVATGVFHSLFEAQDGTLYGVRDGALVRILPDFSTRSVGATVGSDRLAYAQVGTRIYFASASTTGIILPNDTVEPWGETADRWVSPVVNPTDTYHDVRGKLLGAPPTATSLLAHQGRIYCAHGQDLWATEPFLYNYVDKTRNFLRFESPITGLAGVANGFFVGTEERVWFLSGPFAEMRRELVLRSGLVPGSIVPVGGESLPMSRIQGADALASRPAVLFLTPDGVCAGLDSGACFNLTAAKMVFPDAEYAAALLRTQDGVTQYLAATAPGGTPVSTARVGDYVDAEIIRHAPGA